MPTMTHIVTTTCPPHLATEVFFDWSRDALWRPTVRRTTVHPAGPAVIGQRIVEELRLAGLTFLTPTRIESVHPCRVTWAGTTDQVAVRGWREVEETGSGGCRLAEVVDVRLRGALRPLTPLLAPLYRRAMRIELQRLVRHLESLVVVAA
jgi:hypothetical protein